MHELRTELESAVERRSVGEAVPRYVPVMAPPSAVVEDKTTRVPDPTDAPLAAGLAEAVGITGSRGVGRRRGDRTRVRLLGALAIGAIFFALGVLVFARRSGHEPVSAASPAASSELSRRAPPVRRTAPPATTVAPQAAAPAAPARLETGGSPAPPLAPLAEAPKATPTPAPRSPRPEERPVPAEGQARPEPGASRSPPAVQRYEVRPEILQEDDGAAEPESEPEPEPSPNEIGGRWEMTNHIEATSYEPFQDMLLGYEVTLVQDGDRVHGRGRKVSENGQPLPQGQRTPIDVVGRIENGQLVLHFTELGSSRTSRGTIRWRLVPGGANLAGRFSSDAAASSGASVGRRIR